MRELPTNEKARILIRAACGEEYGDGILVTDVAHDYVEPGYRLGSDDGIIVFGNWNERGMHWSRDLNGWDRTGQTKADTIPRRLADALERIGADLEWCDEWNNCGNCYRAMRTVENSYVWRVFGAFVECEYVCGECLLADAESCLGPTR